MFVGNSGPELELVSPWGGQGSGTARAGITIVLSTRNGARTLPAVLRRYADLQPAPVPHRFVVVDNGSTDDARGLLDAHLDRLPLTVLEETRQGKNCALNRALPEVCSSDLVLFTDDDVVPDLAWLPRFWSAARENPGFDVFGGPIRPRWPVSPPNWLFDWGIDLGVVYAITNRQSEGPIDAGLIWGPNMAVRGSVLRRGHRFDEGFGPDGGLLYAMGSETEFSRRLERAGHRAWFVGDAAVDHLIRPEQMTQEWVLGRAFRHGLGHHRLHPFPHGPLYGRGVRIAGLPLRLVFRLAALSAAVGVSELMRSDQRRFRLRWGREWLRGAAAAHRLNEAVPGRESAGPPDRGPPDRG